MMGDDCRCGFIAYESFPAIYIRIYTLNVENIQEREQELPSSIKIKLLQYFFFYTRYLYFKILCSKLIHSQFFVFIKINAIIVNPISKNTKKVT